MKKKKKDKYNPKIEIVWSFNFQYFFFTRINISKAQKLSFRNLKIEQNYSYIS